MRRWISQLINYVSPITKDLSCCNQEEKVQSEEKSIQNLIKNILYHNTFYGFFD